MSSDSTIELAKRAYQRVSTSLESSCKLRDVLIEGTFGQPNWNPHQGPQPTLEFTLTGYVEWLAT
jgi:hypothetical protein